MSSKRKASETTSPSKRSNLPKSHLHWEWEGDRSAWTAFADDHNQEINDAYENDEKSVKMLIAGTEIEVKLDRMVQRNCMTGWERRIRACVEESENFFAWQWQDGRRRWNAYPPKVVSDLEEALKSGQTTVSVAVSQQAYTVDVNKMDQSNDTTSVVRAVQRIKSVHKAPPTEAPAAKKGRSGASTSAANGASGDRSKVKVKQEAGAENVRSKSKPSTSKSSGPAIKTVRLTGNGAPVDSECAEMVGKACVYSEGSTIYDAMLNQTNLKNNNNKYYICQLLQENGKSRYHVWFRWGRVGMKGQNNLIACGPDLADAKSVFEKKFYDKTRNDWAQRNSFEKIPGKYDMLEMDYSTKGKDEPDSAKGVKKEKVPDSKLDKRLQEVIKMICNVRAMEDLIIEMKYDAQKAPLGKLTVDQIKAGNVALKKIETCINNGIVGDKLIKACDEFYTRIPHNFGMQRPPIIRTKQELRAKMALLEALADIQVAMTVLKQERDTSENPIDNQYHSLKCEMKPLSKTHADIKMIKDYVKNTHAKTHTQYTMEVEDVFTLDRQGDTRNFKDVGNRMLLWHGSRLTNMAGILGQGLRIAPPEAPVTGYMFGKGVYFADMSSKSANYCFASKTKPVGFLLLCEVALGKSNDLLAADYAADKLPAGMHSTRGLGKMAPDSGASITMSDGVQVPVGKSCNTGVTNPNGYTLNYNEYVVYDVSQVKMRYLVKTKFNFK